MAKDSNDRAFLPAHELGRLIRERELGARANLPDEPAHGCSEVSASATSARAASRSCLSRRRTARSCSCSAVRTGNWKAALPAPLADNQGLRTMSTVPDSLTITGLRSSKD